MCQSPSRKLLAEVVVLVIATVGSLTVGVANAAPIPGGDITTVCAGSVNGSTFTLTADCGDVTSSLTVPSNITTVDGGGFTISATDIGSTQFNGAILTNASPGQTLNIENLTVSGPATGFQVCTNAGNTLFGIYFNDASGSVNDVTVEHIWQQPNASNAPSCNAGTAIRAQNPSAPRTVTITNTTVLDYQKNGIDGRGVGMTLNVSGSTIGPPNDQEGLIAANGLVYFDSTGTAMNNTILGSGDQGCLPLPAVCTPGTGGATDATAVLLWGARNVTITHNTIGGGKTDIGVAVQNDSTGNIISFNNITRTTADDPDPTGHGIDVFTPDGSSATPICNTFSNWTTNIVGALQISCTPLPDGTECQAYSANVLSSEGGMAPITWSVASGTPPPGLTLAASDGAITGTPTQTGTFDFTVQVVAADNQTATATKTSAGDVTVVAAPTGQLAPLTATQAQTITIAPDCAPPPVVTPPSDPENRDAFCYGTQPNSYAWYFPSEVARFDWKTLYVAFVVKGVDPTGVMQNGFKPYCGTGTVTGHVVDNQGENVTEGYSVAIQNWGGPNFLTNPTWLNPNGKGAIPEWYQEVTP